MNDSSWKVDTGHKSDYLTFTEKEVAKVLPNAELKADPHIKSKVKILKKQLSYILEIQQNGSGFRWDNEKKMVTGDRETYMGWAKSREGAAPMYMKPMMHFEKLCEVYASDLAKGGNAKSPGEQEGAECEPIVVEGDRVNQHVDEAAAQKHDNSNPPAGSKPGRKRIFADVDTLELGLVNVSNSFATFLEAEKENNITLNGMQKAMMHGVDQVQEKIAADRIKLFEALQKLPGLTIEQVVMAVRIIGRNAGDIDLFLKMTDEYKLVFVLQELGEAPKQK